jgi:hypothetical protein
LQLDAEPVGHQATQRLFDAFGKIGRNGQRSTLEGTRQRSLKFAIGNRFFKGLPVHADPGPAPGGTRHHVRQHVAIGRDGKTRQLVPRIMAPGQHALALRRGLPRRCSAGDVGA